MLGIIKTSTEIIMPPPPISLRKGHIWDTVYILKRPQPNWKQHRKEQRLAVVPVPQLFCQLVEDLNGLPVIIKLSFHQRRELTHLLDLKQMPGGQVLEMPQC